MVSERRCVELRVDDLDDREMVRLRELDTKVLSLSDLLEFQLKRMKREAIQERVRWRARRAFSDKVQIALQPSSKHQRIISNSNPRICRKFEKL